jgi:small redox-active disulfide protein 2
MKIEILGTGCPKCKKLYELASAAVKEAGVQADVTKVEKIADIINYGVMMTPAIVIDGQVKASGKVPDIAQIKQWIQGK